MTPTTDELFERVWGVLELLREAAEGWPTPNRFTDAAARGDASLAALRTRFEQLEEERDAAKALLHSSVKEIADDAFRRAVARAEAAESKLAEVSSPASGRDVGHRPSPPGSTITGDGSGEALPPIVEVGKQPFRTSNPASSLSDPPSSTSREGRGSE